MLLEAAAAAAQLAHRPQSRHLAIKILVDRTQPGVPRRIARPGIINLIKALSHLCALKLRKRSHPPSTPGHGRSPGRYLECGPIRRVTRHSRARTARSDTEPA